MAKTRIDFETFAKEYKIFQRLKKNLGTDEEFAAYLNKNYKKYYFDNFLQPSFFL